MATRRSRCRRCRRPSTRAATTCRRWSRSILNLFDGETLGLVGESGSGKSTLAKTILGIESPDAGSSLEFDDHALAAQSSGRPTADKRALQMVFQNPDSALNRGWTARAILARSVSKLTGLKGKAVNERVDKLAADLRLTQRHLDLKPRQLSGGLKQRVAIARAFAGDPRIVVADEPTSALDVSVQAAILNLLSELQLKSKTSYLLISHDLGVVRYLADRIAVMYLGRIMEVGGSEKVFSGPNHPYTEALLSAVPNVDGEARARILLEGEIPSPANPPSGCVFNTRCHRVIRGLCEVTEPPLVEVEPGHLMSCHIPLEELRRLQKRAAATGETLVTPPADESGEAGAAVEAAGLVTDAAEPTADVAEPTADAARADARLDRHADDARVALRRGTAMPKKLILDVDTGTDDAVALMLAALHPDLELVAATTVNGNNPIANCTDNTLRVFDLLERAIPVHEGAASPLVRDDFPIPRAILHRAGSMHGLELPIPAPRSVKQAQRAAEFLVETYMAATRADHPGAGRSADQHRDGDQAGAADRRADPRDGHHGRRSRQREHDARRRVQHLGRPGGGARRLRSRPGERDARAARRHAPGARLIRGLRAAARAGHAGGRRRGGIHRGPDHGL